jgi:hypothetical protein
MLFRSQIFLFFCVALLQSFSISAQTVQTSIKRPLVVFAAHPEQRFGFDAYKTEEWKLQYEKIKIDGVLDYYASNKSIGDREGDKVNALIQNIANFDQRKLKFFINDSIEFNSYFRLNDSTITLLLPLYEADYKIHVRYNKKLVGQLNVKRFTPIQEKIILVNLTENKIDNEKLTNYLKSVFSQANIDFEIIKSYKYKDTLFDPSTVFINPSSQHDRYTQQMRSLRDAFFESNPKATKNAYYIFLVPEFVDPSIRGYMVKNKAMAFVRNEKGKSPYASIARQLAVGIGLLEYSWENEGPQRGTTMNLMDQKGGNELTLNQWYSLRHQTNTFSFYDGDEEVITNNGIVAYYFWKENKDGFIELNGENPLSLIHRPYKKNYVSYHLNIRDVMFEIIFEFRGYFITWWHVLTFSSIFLTYFTIRFVQWWKRRKKEVKPGFFKRKLTKYTLLVSAIVCTTIAFQFISYRLRKNEVTSGLIADFKGHSLKKVSDNILYNKNLKYKEEKKLKSEILLKRESNWYVKRRKKVLYFNVYLNEKGEYDKCKFVADSDSLILDKHAYREKAESHYTVFNFQTHPDSSVTQKAYNHFGIEMSDKLEIQDAAKRILLFVNGYRPSSIGHSFEDNFADIKKNGLELPNSSNLIYNYDRYDYWQPWQQMDTRFQERINPTEIYYADGHHSVSTSNHGSLLNFSTLSAQYPKRCSDPKKHTCLETDIKSTGIFGVKTVHTYDMLPHESNKKGFKMRRENGRIAAQNLMMMCNEIPNKSSNDTLYIVAHSMGYAYSLGMIEELRGKIHFGGFYIIAPENAGQGTVKRDEWKEVWQYGSRLSKKSKDAPCLQDGIAPQTAVGGLGEFYRSYIPNQFYKRKGFFDSHFIGYYTWIFDLKPGEKGAIRQR